MADREALLGTLAGRPAAALLVGGRLEDLLLTPPDTVPRVGAIHAARLSRPVKGLGGAFVDLGKGLTGYLRQTKGLAQGRPLLVQVTGHAEPGKAVPVTARLLHKGRHAILTPSAPGRNLSRGIADPQARAALEALAAGLDLPEGWGVILRGAAAAAAPEAVRAEVAALRAEAEAVLAAAPAPPRQIQPGPDSAARAAIEWGEVPLPLPGDFAARGILEAVDALAGAEPLPGGGTMHVEATRALVAVDVNTGPDHSPAAGLKANLAAVKALPRALRLRGLGGQVVIDLAPLSKVDRRRVEQAAESALRGDPVSTAIAGWSALGHLELQRRRERWPLAEALAMRET